jgi:hypothetical protein
MSRQERRTNAERRRRIDELLARVSAAREEIVEAGLEAVHDSRAADEASRSGRFTRTPKTDAPSANVPARGTHPDG